MSKKELKKLAEAGFIPGIYNFCDRWCEKCTQKTKCMSFVVGKKMEEKLGTTFEGGNLQAEKENTWVYLKNIFDSTYEILHDLAEERGIEIEDIYASEDVDKGLWADEYNQALQDEEYNDLEVTVSEIVQICIIYENLSEECLEKVFAVLDEKEWEPDSFEGKETTDALDKISWYLDVIQSKIRRALLGHWQSRDAVVRKQSEDDCNGSAKVALLCMEASDMSWEILKKYCPLEVKKNIIHLQVVLGQLVRDVEARFPDARKFRRPGFDL